MCSRLCTRPCTGGSANTAVYMAVNTYGRILYSTVLVLFTVYTGNDFKGKEKGKTIELDERRALQCIIGIKCYNSGVRYIRISLLFLFPVMVLPFSFPLKSLPVYTVNNTSTVE